MGNPLEQNRNIAEGFPMGTAAPSSTLHRLRQALAGIDPGLAPRLGEERLLGLGAPIDAALGGGLACGALHELAPAAPVHLAATSGFAMALAALASGLHLSPPCEERESTRLAICERLAPRGQALWIATDFATGEGGGPYGPGLDLFGLSAARLLVLRVPRALDVLWAMEEALRCRALACVAAELTGDGEAADLTATRRLALAAREGGSGLGLLIRHRASAAPSAAATRWQIAAALSRPDAFGGLGSTRFDLSLCKNRRGPFGRWTISWDHHARIFHAAVSVGVAATALDRPDRAPLARAG
jgi:protein ImuA